MRVTRYFVPGIVLIILTRRRGATQHNPQFLKHLRMIVRVCPLLAKKVHACVITCLPLVIWVPRDAFHIEASLTGTARARHPLVHSMCCLFFACILLAPRLRIPIADRPFSPKRVSFIYFGPTAGCGNAKTIQYCTWYKGGFTAAG